MRQSQLFTKTSREAPKDEVSLNAQLLIRGGFINKTMAGVYSYLPLGLKVLDKIKNIVREEMNAIGGQEILMSAMTPKSIWEKTDRYDNFDALYKFKGTGDKDYVLGATHEEVVTPLVKRFVNSYKDLPIYVYQIQDKYRNEPRAKSGLLRGREFSMKDLYSFHTDQEDLDEYYEKAKEAYFKIFERLELKDITYLTFATGGAFSKYSHEFQTITENGEDTIFLCEGCKVALNKELLESEDKKCPQCGNKDLIEKNAIEVGNIFKLGTKFSKAFESVYVNKDGKQQDIIMGCYGLGPSRVMGAIVEIFGKENKIFWPKEIAPYQVHLINLSKDSSVSDEQYKIILKNKIEVLYDDRDESVGVKFKDAELIGVPVQIIIGDKNPGMAEIRNNENEKVEMIEIDKLEEYIK